MPDGPSAKPSSGARRQLLQGVAATAAAIATTSTVAAEPTATAGATTKMRPTSADRRRAGLSRPEAPGKGLPALPSLGLIALNRMGFGPRQGDVAAFNALGADPISRLTAYVDQQLSPNSITDPEVNARFAAAGFQTLNKSRTQLWADHNVNNSQGGSYRALPRDEVEAATIIRALYSKRQLLEVIAGFWHDHFSVDAGDYWVQPVFSYYDREVIRANAFGNFRTMLGLVARSTSMLYYLDNYTSSNAGPNENYSRELFELHTLGAENYLGVVPQQDVPTDGDGFPLGYVDGDVFETTRCLTGWTVNNSSSFGNTGDFLYRGEWHDRFQKFVLGEFIPPDQPDQKDGDDVLDRLAAHPGTGRHIARKLCRKLIADDPPQSIVDQAAALFTAQKDAPDQLRQVIRLILLSEEFRTTYGEKVKRPFEITMSALRAGGADFTAKTSDSETSSFLSNYNRAGQRLFRWPAPNGYPDVRQAWQSATPRTMTWRLCNWLITWDDSDDNYFLDVVGQTPSGLRTATELVDYWINRIFFRPISAIDRQEYIDFMAQGFSPDIDLPIDSSSSTADRLRSMVGLMFMAPDFLWR